MNNQLLLDTMFDTQMEILNNLYFHERRKITLDLKADIFLAKELNLNIGGSKWEIALNVILFILNQKSYGNLVKNIFVVLTVIINLKQGVNNEFKQFI